MLLNSILVTGHQCELKLAAVVLNMIEIEHIRTSESLALCDGGMWVC